MSVDKDKLFSTLGELIYVVAQADGIIQNNEIRALNELIASHPWAASISWSFNYELDHDNDVEDLYQKALDACHSYGPTPEYDYFIEVLNIVASASEGIDEYEQEAIGRFSKDLIERFIKDTEKLRS